MQGTTRTAGTRVPSGHTWHPTDSPIVATVEGCARELDIPEVEVIGLLGTVKPWGFNARHEVVYRLDDIRERLGLPRVWQITGKRRKKRKTYIEDNDDDKAIASNDNDIEQSERNELE